MHKQLPALAEITGSASTRHFRRRPGTPASAADRASAWTVIPRVGTSVAMVSAGTRNYADDSAEPSSSAAVSAALSSRIFGIKERLNHVVCKLLVGQFESP
jgi:hypothetical protein